MLVFVLTRLCYSACNIFYDSMLVDVTSDERMDRVSSYGYALGYIGSCIPFVIGILLILVRPFGLSTQTATQISFVITALWWAALTVPLLKNVQQTPLSGAPGKPGQARLFPRGADAEKNPSEAGHPLLHHRLLLLHRRRVHHHLDGNHLRRRGGHQRHQHDSGAAADPVCRLPLRHLCRTAG